MNSRKLHTEPAKLKPSSLAAPLTPNNTPPWKAFANSFKNIDFSESPTKDFHPTRLKLVFDDNDNDQITSSNNNENKSPNKSSLKSFKSNNSPIKPSFSPQKLAFKVGDSYKSG